MAPATAPPLEVRPTLTASIGAIEATVMLTPGTSARNAVAAAGLSSTSPSLVSTADADASEEMISTVRMTEPGATVTRTLSAATRTVSANLPPMNVSTAGV